LEPTGKFLPKPFKKGGRISQNPKFLEMEPGKNKNLGNDW